MLELLVTLDPSLDDLLMSVQNKLTQLFNISLSLKVNFSFRFSDVYMNSETLTQNELKDFNKKLDQAVKNKTGRRIGVSGGSSRARVPVKVVPLHSSITHADHNNKLTKIEDGVNGKYLAEYADITNSGIVLSLVNEFCDLLHFLDLKRPHYFPSTASEIAPLTLCIDVAPALLETKWKFAGAYINGKVFFNENWFGTSQQEEAGRDPSWEGITQKLLENPTQPRPQPSK